MTAGATPRWLAQSGSARWLLLFLAILAATYWSTFAYPYLLLDETWLVKEGTHKWTYHLGRPLFTILAWLTAKLASYMGLDVIYAMRFFAVVFLALACLYLMRWLRAWGHGEAEAGALALAAMTLPAFQIVVADGTQLAAAIFLAVFATCQFHAYAWRSQLARYGVTAVLLFGALLIYQQQILIALAMLCVPLLRSSTERRTYKLVASYGALVAGVCALYFIVWKATYQRLLAGRVDQRYGPDAVRPPGYEQLTAFFDTRLAQVANLWNVDPPQWNWIAAAVVLLALVAVIGVLWRAPRLFALNLAMLLGLLIGTDSIALAARAYPSYVTATALSLLVFYWAYAGAAVLLSRFSIYGAVLLAVFGCVSAHITVREAIAVPNWAEMQKTRNALLANSDATSFHFVGTPQGGPKNQEFGWRNSNTDGYILYAVQAIADDLTQSGEMTRSRRNALHVSIEGVAVRSIPESSRVQKKADAFVQSLQ